jgi:iron-sulfur cluster assembly accessory protein
MSITITDFAAEKISNLMKKSQCEKHLLRVGLNGGGCSGYTYSFEFIPEAFDDDKVFDFGNIKICIDKKSYLF